MMAAKRFLVLLPLLVLALAPGALADSDTRSREVPPARARAWVARLAVPGREVLELGSVAAEGGAVPHATATPGAFGGESPLRVSASPEQQDAVATPMTWDDPTDSGHVEGAFSEAHVSGDSANARAGAAMVSGSGFAMANQLMTWEQQEQLIGQWSEINATVFEALNEQLQALEPALGVLGLRLPRLEPMAGLGFIDVLNAEAVSARSEASSSPSFSSARSAAQAGAIELFGGFLVIEDVAVEAVSESAGGVDDRTVSSSVGGITIGGVDVVVTEDGLEAGPNELLSLLPLPDKEQALDLLLEALNASGVDIRVGDTRAAGDLREAVALEVEMVSAAGRLLVSIAHAEASAASVAGFAFEAPSLPPLPASTTEAKVETSVAIPAPSGRDVQSEAPPVADASAMPEGDGPQRYALPAQPTLGPAAVRALETVYMTLMAGGVLAALMIPAVVSTRPRQRVRTRDPLVTRPAGEEE